MTALDLNKILFAIAVIAFAIIGLSAAYRQKSAKDYFHDNNLFKNVVSLSATDISLGTGLVYLVTGAQYNGLLMLLVPLMLWVGYFLQSVFLEKIVAVTSRTGKNYIESINEQISVQLGSPAQFSRIVSGSLVTVFVLILAFEIFASSKVISPFLFKTSGVNAEIWLSLIIFSITILYSILGGINACFKVDEIQVPLLLLFLPVLFFTSVPEATNPAALTQRLAGSLKLDSAVLAAVAVAMMNSLATQFYSIINWGAISHVNVKDQKRLLRWTGAMSASIFIVFILVGLLHPTADGQSVWHDITSSYSILTSQSNFSAYIISGILVLGLASILLTTTDAVVITSIMFWYDNVMKGNSLDTTNDPHKLRSIRMIGAVTFMICFVVLGILNYFQPDPFFFLLSLAGGVIVFAPMIVAVGYLSSKGDSLKIFNNKVVYLYLTLFIVAGLFNIVLLIMKSSFIGYLGVIAFAVSSLLSIGLIVKSRYV